MALSSWWQVAEPHKDIKEGKLNEAIFAADLGDVVRGNAPLEYKDASVFFQKTYLTCGLNNLLENVLSRLCGKKGDSVIQLQTPFGGGKTHALLSLWHIVKNRNKISHVSEISKLPEAKNAKVAVFVGTQGDALLGKTPWGEIAEQLGQYKIVKEHDVKRVSPGKDKLRQVLNASGPTLILMDELLEYIVKANRAEKVEKITQGQTLAFLQEISEVVASSENCCLVITLPASILERYDEEAERTLKQLQKITGRVEAIYTPVEGIELYEVIRKRLFENIGEEKARKKAAEQYFKLYQSLSADIPPEAKEVEYRDRIEKAYPFHPELIDVLYERWGSYPTFQRTRGVLRLLAQVVGDLYSRKIVSPLIQSSLVNLGSQEIRREFIKHIGNEFDSVISSDIAGKNAKALKVDKEMGSEYEKYCIAGGIATSVFLYSFSAGTSKETTLPRIRVSVIREGIPSTIVGDAIAKLEENLWFFHSERNQFSFRNQANLNRVIIDREELFEDKAKEELKIVIQKNSGRSFEVYLWPEESSDIPDSKNLKLAIFAPDLFYNFEKSKKFAVELFDKAGSGFRVYKNNLFILLMDDSHYVVLTKSIKRYLALQDVLKDEKLIETVSKQSHDELKKKLKDAEREMPFKILTAYRFIYFIACDKPKDMGIPTIGSEETISERVKQYLKDQDKLLDSLTPKYILEKAFAKNENEKTIREIYELHLKTPGMPIPENDGVLLNTVTNGVKTGILGLLEGDTVYYKENVSPNIDSIVLRGEFALEKKREKEAKEAYISPHVTPPLVEETTTPGQKPEWPITQGNKTNVSIKAKIPWDKISSIVSGVISPLKAVGEPPEIILEINAYSKEGYDRNTLDNKVKETLHQIGAEIKEWEER